MFDLKKNTTQKEIKYLIEDSGTIKTEARLNFVDLAGSEKVSNHHETAEDKEV
jgi:hypothetical protein